MAPKIYIAVYCYNRPGVLRNCLDSLREMAPDTTVEIFDDQSTNPKVAPVLEASEYRVHYGQGGKGRHGGLYRNMQKAYEIAREGGYEYLINMQDDMQMVRPLDAAVVAEYQAYFERVENLCEIDIRFQRQESNEKLDRDLDCYWSPEPERGFGFFTDVGMFHIGRLAERDWKFDLFGNSLVPDEVDLNKRAAELDMRRLMPLTPITAHVPFPDLYRNGIRLPRLSGLTGKIYRFDYMTPEECTAMDARDISVQPKFRDFLTISNLTAWDRWLMRTKNDYQIF